MSFPSSRFRKHRSPPLGLPGANRNATTHFNVGRVNTDRARSGHRAAIEGLEQKIVLATTVLADYAVTQNWGSGLEGRITLTNRQTTPVNNWTLEFDFGATITSIWDGHITSHVGTRYVVANNSWNSTLAAGGQVAFGFIAAPNKSPTSPINYILNGKPLSGDVTPLPSITIADATMSEGNSGTKNITFTVTLSAASTSTVTVNYATRNGAATAGTPAAGADYTAASGTLAFSPGQISKTVDVVILGDVLFEPDESFYLDLSAATGATLARSTATGTILNDDPQPSPPPSTNGLPAAIAFMNTSDWGSGFNGEVAIRNTGTATIRNWKLQFTFAGQISSIWNASIVSHSGSTYVVQAASWNKEIAPGQSIGFGFTGSPGGAAAVLSNFTLSGTTDGGTSGSTGGNTGGSTGTSNQPLASSQIAWPAHYYVPYVDSTLWPLYDFVGTAKSSGLRFFTLAFITADSGNKPAWGGYSAYDVGTTDFDAQMKTNIAALRAIGGDVMVSFGGAAGQELAQVITGVGSLTAAYQSVITAYGLTHIDFDIEGAAVADRASIDRRSQAIAAVQQAAASAGRKLDVWFTLPVLPTGLTADGLYVIQSALRYGVTISGVNIMTMDYGDSAAPNPAGHMGDFAIQAATSLFAQLKTSYGGALTDAQTWAKIGLTPMIGMNDIQSEVFTQSDAQKLLTFAQQHGIGRISIWSLNRDYQNSAGALSRVDNFSSSLVQSPLEFSLLLNRLTG